MQIKGKVRAKLEVSADIDPDELEKMALEAVAERLGGKPPRKVIVKARRSFRSSRANDRTQVVHLWMTCVVDITSSDHRWPSSLQCPCRHD